MYCYCQLHGTPRTRWLRGFHYDAFLAHDFLFSSHSIWHFSHIFVYVLIIRINDRKEFIEGEESFGRLQYKMALAF